MFFYLNFLINIFTPWSGYVKIKQYIKITKGGRLFMDFRPDIDAHLAAKKRQYTKKKKRMKRLLAVLLIITILAVWALIGFIAYRLISDNSPTPPPAVSTGEVTEEIPVESTPPVTVATAAPKTVTLTLNEDDIHRGNLILVSFVRDA